MNDRPKRTIAIISSALALGGIGTGLALGATNSPSTTPSATPSVTSPAPTADVPTPGDKADTGHADPPGQQIDHQDEGTQYP